MPIFTAKRPRTSPATPDKDWYVCSVCGYTIAGAAPDKCPVCQALAKAFFKVD